MSTSLARACAALFPEWADFGRVLMDLRLEDARKMRRFFRAIRGDLAAVIAEGQQDGSIAASPDADVQSSVLIGAIDGLLFQHFADRRAFQLDALGDELARISRKGLAA